MAAQRRSVSSLAKSATVRVPGTPSDAWQHFLREFERQERLWGEKSLGENGADVFPRGASGREPLDKADVVRRLIALLSRES